MLSCVARSSAVCHAETPSAHAPLRSCLEPFWRAAEAALADVLSETAAGEDTNDPSLVQQLMTKLRECSVHEVLQLMRALSNAKHAWLAHGDGLLTLVFQALLELNGLPWLLDKLGIHNSAFNFDLRGILAKLKLETVEDLKRFCRDPERAFRQLTQTSLELALASALQKAAALELVLPASLREHLDLKHVLELARLLHKRKALTFTSPGATLEKLRAHLADPWGLMLMMINGITAEEASRTQHVSW